MRRSVYAFMRLSETEGTESLLPSCSLEMYKSTMRLQSSLSAIKDLTNDFLWPPTGLSRLLSCHGTLLEHAFSSLCLSSCFQWLWQSNLLLGRLSQRVWWLSMWHPTGIQKSLHASLSGPRYKWNFGNNKHFIHAPVMANFLLKALWWSLAGEGPTAF